VQRQRGSADAPPLDGNSSLRGEENLRDDSGMDDRQLQEFLEGFEIPIAMDERVLIANAKRGDETINRFPNSVASAAKDAIIQRCFSGQIDTARVEHLKLQQLALDIFGNFVANTLQDFTENQVDEAQALAIEFHMNPIGFGIRNAFQVVDPDGGVDDDHVGYFATRPRRDVSRSPSQVTFPRNRRTLF
jgi:hypothetical protein